MYIPTIVYFNVNFIISSHLNTIFDYTHILWELLRSIFMYIYILPNDIPGRRTL